MTPKEFTAIEWQLKRLYNEVRDKNDPDFALTVLDKRKGLILTAIRDIVHGTHHSLTDYRNVMNDIHKLLGLITF